MTEHIKQELLAPASGKCIPASQAENADLRNKTLGDGIAIYPDSGAIHAPCDGRVSEIAATGHFIKIITEDELELIIQLGMDTETLGGQGFRILVQQGHRVRRGRKIATMNINMIESEGYDLTVSLLITNMQLVNNIKATRGDVGGGKDIALTYSKN